MAILQNKADNIGGGHWYTPDGVPAYTMKKKDGGDRKTTLRDARKHMLVPSVTTVFGIMAKPALDRWKTMKTIDAALSTERNDNEDDKSYYNRILSRSNQETSEAANLGTRIHDAIDQAFDGIPVPEDLLQYVSPTMLYLHDLELKNITREKVVVNNKEGYGGRVDLLAEYGKGNIIIDFKTRKSKEGEKMTPYEFQPTQIAAYAMAAFGTLDNCWGANLYISTTEAGRIETCVYEPEMLKKEYETFLNMTSLWRYIKNFDPRQNI